MTVGDYRCAERVATILLTITGLLGGFPADAETTLRIAAQKPRECPKAVAISLYWAAKDPARAWDGYEYEYEYEIRV